MMMINCESNFDNIFVVVGNSPSQQKKQQQQLMNEMRKT
jgi:hypothetical protein